MVIDLDVTDLSAAFSIVVNECPLGIIIVDSSGIIKSANKKLCSFSGYDIDDLIEADIDILTYHRSAENSLRNLFDIHVSNLNFCGNIQLRLSSGKSSEQKVRMTPFRNNSDSEQYYILYLDLDGIEEETNYTKNNSQSLISLGKMAAFLSHEIKTPLTSIKMNVDMISRDPNLPVSRVRSMQIIKNEISRLERLSKDVLHFSKSTANNHNHFDLYELVNEISSLLSAQFSERNICLINKLGKKFIIYGARHDLKAMFMHLVENSIESIKSDGTIEIWGDTEAMKSVVSVFLRDNGEGIKNPENIFELFFTSKSTGTGLGLSIAKKIVENHSGAIELISGEKRNTVFKISLPGGSY